MTQAHQQLHAGAFELAVKIGVLPHYIQEAGRLIAEFAEKHAAGVSEILQMQLAACMTATIQNTETTIKDRITQENPYWCQAYADVCAAVDREMVLRSKRDELLKILAIEAETNRIFQQAATTACDNAKAERAYSDERDALLTERSKECAALRREVDSLPKVTPTMQTKHGIGGNCLAAALASIFNVPLESIPDMAPETVIVGETKQTVLLRAWLLARGYHYLEIDLSRQPFSWTDGAIPNVPCLLAVKSETLEVVDKGFGHFVVGTTRQDGDKVEVLVLHDPNGRKAQYTATAIGFFVPIKP